jgi:GntR family transcriptional repressor for pyruvate dehydrogenase complex
MAKRVLARIKRLRIKEQVFEQLRDQIIAGTWPPGSKIPSENDLTRSLGVSRVSVREALHMLASLGLLHMRQGEGTFVKEFSGAVQFNSLFPMIALDKTDILHVLEYRRIMERGTVALVVERAGEKEVAELERAYAAMTANAGNIHTFARADLDFHLALAKATLNPIVIKVNDIIKSVLGASMDGIVGALGVDDGLLYHKKILDAIKARDAALAESLMEEHVTRTIKRLATKKGKGKPHGDTR